MGQELSGDFVTYRELLALLDQRDVRLDQHIRLVDERINVLDDRGSRGLQAVVSRLDTVVRDLEEHAEQHRESKAFGVSTAQWAITTALAGLGVFVSAIAILIPAFTH